MYCDKNVFAEFKICLIFSFTAQPDLRLLQEHVHMRRLVAACTVSTAVQMKLFIAWFKLLSYVVDAIPGPESSVEAF